ncbi:MAG TPA: Ig-like domain-containing protein [Saprospiraceae bacterium]|nr:Ig-like domain-containing protein [Saprospiraceae bacterium]HMP26137.1 Ig-like domain-containing protein [Saprospiraceae bacterium]
MNVFLRKHLLLFTLIACTLPAWGQLSNRSLQTDQGQAVSETLTALTTQQYSPVVVRNAVNGTVQIQIVSASTVQVVYTPNPSFIGVDNFRIQRFTCSLCVEFIDYTVQVTPSQIKANHDYSFAARNATIPVNVLDNDVSSNGVLELRLISMTNNGTATFAPGSGIVEFTPDADFEGIAYFNYVVCNGLGLCDNGTVTVQVLGDNSNSSDTLRVFTKKNLAQTILIPNTFELSDGPANGSYNTSGDAPAYIPANGFTGRDYIRFRNGNTDKVVEVVVIDAEDNTIAFDDEAYTSPDNPVEINVLDNDLYGADSGCFSIQAQPQFGTLEADNGMVLYIPRPGFKGVDWFTYSVNAPGCGAADETATVYVYISNFEPILSKFHMSTPKQTPLIIGNNVPISNFMYKIRAQGRLGTALILEGARDTVIYNQTVAGNNLIIYLPNQGVSSGTDEFEITYCVFDYEGNCVYEKSVKVEIDILNIASTNEVTYCFNDCIWPGDTNRDGVVNMEDLLPIGVRMGAVGTPRSEADASHWYGQYGNDWSDDLGEVNLKHLDTDGDSVVTALDTAAIREYYGFTHDLTSAKVPFYKHDIALAGDIFFNPGDLVELDMIFGEEDSPVLDLYGFTFAFEYEPIVFKPESVSIDYSGLTWLNYNSPILQMSQNNMRGLLETGFTRTSGVAASGFGEIGKIRFVVRDDIAGFRVGDEPLLIEIGGGNSVASNSAGQTFGVQVRPWQIQIVAKSQEEIENTPLTEDLLKVYPNPTSDLLNIHLNGGQEFEQVLVYNMSGQLVFNSGKTLARWMQIDTKRFNNGIYVLSVVSPKGVLNKKFEVLR